MRRTFILLVAIVFVVAILSLTVTYTVRFTEHAVLTTFGSADESDVIRTPGLKFKWPEPIQSVTKYDKRTRFLAQRLETQQTADESLITVEAFCTWRVDNPLEFFKRFSHAGDGADDHFRMAENEVLRPALRSALSETSKFRMSELFTADPTGSRLPELEQRILQALRASLAGTGIEVVGAGISRVVLPQQASAAVFARMKEERTALVKGLQSKGEAEAQAIIANAESTAKKIEEFALARAAAIRARGVQEATQFVEAMNEHPDLAVFLREVEFLREALSKKSTLIFQTSMPGFGLFSFDAGAKARSGQMPGLAGMEGWAPSDVPERQTAGSDDDEPGVPISAASERARPAGEDR